jgi:hypothetical protein
MGDCKTELVVMKIMAMCFFEQKWTKKDGAKIEWIV